MTPRLPYSLILGVASALVTVFLVPLAMRLALRIGAVAQPGARHVHRDPVPRLGGLAMAAGVLGVSWACYLLPGPAHHLDPRFLLGLTLASIPILALGVVDDARGTSPLAKLGVQACAAVVLAQYGFGVHVVTNPLGDPIAAGWLNLPLTIVWVLVVTNAINLIDGLDGLAAGVVLIAAMTLWWTGRVHQDFYVMFLAAPLAGATLGFLRWNFPRARAFMGDTGSQFLGLALAAISLLENRKGTATVTLLLPLVALFLPIADGVLAFARRAASGEPVFRADSSHIHHRLLHLGLSPRNATLLMWGVSLALALVAIALEGRPRRAGWITLASLAAVLWIAFEVLEGVERRRRRSTSTSSS
ncbi:MAG: undecaprenyl/decaprenyl-phosphate alpha-N-acetylglucosaminyl 1-phosphate transferase [Candidatus Eisenbacteria bacterium]|uniref:Undecaprenyl/decaprenyl-phosphate alpha-N-acetylglucosaminyl 1-phosphate transferase n=1 Tax=Eiseniibacteriota bacterium TaxID=2212470 RepID=A0A849SH42_UNCEI|nr:undecaprenyl/decaprenyl-phosphate alpha-N-acetylglucosaminyl 1-phosphate transferase [Candidatus Eisenbacteria bacterium]